MSLIHLALRRGEAVADVRTVDGSGLLYFCARGACPHYQGQLGIFPGAESMVCALVHYPPDRTCQPFYLETAEALDSRRRDIWQRLAEAEALESAVQAVAEAV